MAGISSKASGKLENRFKFNSGTELNSDFDLNWYETRFRGYDPQTGRFNQIDPLADYAHNWSSYTYVMNNPTRYNDPWGLDTTATTVIDGKMDIKKNPEQGDVLSVTNEDGTKSFYTYDSENKDANSHGYIGSGMEGAEDPSSNVIVTAPAKTKESCPTCLDPSTLGQNLFGLSYPGGNNPRDFSRRFSYSYRPKDISEFPAIGHDRRYDRLHVEGAKGLFMDTRAIGADYLFVKQELSIYFNTKNDPDSRKHALALGAGLGLAALPKTLYKIITTPSGANGLGAYNEIFLNFVESDIGVTNQPSSPN